MRCGLLTGVAILLSIGGSAVAGERYGVVGPGYGASRGVSGANAYDGYRFANEAVGGDYVGAPFTRFPRPSTLVPPVWGYGTYGVPTMTGIRQAPIGDPKIYVVRGIGPSAHRTGRGFGGATSDAEGPSGGPHIVSVTVPRR